MEQKAEMLYMWPNERAAGKGGTPSLLRIGRARPALPEHECWAEPIHLEQLTPKTV